jgi:hypothetical protein
MHVLAGESDWVIISGDVRISRNPHEVAAWREAGHTIFFLKAGWTNLQFWEQAYKFVKSFPGIIATAERAKSGTIFMVSVNGKVG